MFMKKTLLTFFAILASGAMFAQTVYQIQYTTDPSGNSPYATQTVTTQGTVVGIYTSSLGVRSGFYIQGAAGAWNGLYVYAGTTGAGASQTCVVGDSVSVAGTVSEYNGLTELGTITACTVIASGKTYIINDVTTNDANTEKWESCLVRVKNANCTSTPSAGTYVVTDGSGPLSIYKQLFQALALTTGSNYDITGVVTWFNSGLVYELYPRNANDITPSTSAGFSSPKADVLSLSLIGRNLTITNVANGTTVDIYSAIGARVQSAQLQNGAVQLTNLAKGLYIVRVGKLSSKIML
jgi:DNA/RNA endonuclease YhcR with UshA esterase domain